MKRYLHIKYDDSYKLIWYQFTDECMVFNIHSELVDNHSGVYDRIGIYYNGIRGHINVDLDIFQQMDNNPYFDILFDLVKQVNMIENRSKLIKKILG